jgi:uncharacterized membrane protein HdeD (DUF308 family)
MTSPNMGPQMPNGNQPNGQNGQNGQNWQPNGQPNGRPNYYQTPSYFNPQTDDRSFFGWSPLDMFGKTIKAVRNWMIWGGVVLFLIGLCLLIWPGRSLMVATVIISIISLVGGIGSLITAFTAHGAPTGWRVLDGISGVFFILAAAVLMRNLTSSTEWLILFTSIFLGITWIIQGIMQLVETSSFLNTGWSIFAAIMSIIAGFIILFSPITSMYWLVIIIAIVMMVQGFTSFIRGLNIPNPKKNN